MNPPGRAQHWARNWPGPVGRIGMLAWLCRLCLHTGANLCLQLSENPSSWFDIYSCLKPSFSNKENRWHFPSALISTLLGDTNTSLALLAVPGKVFSRCGTCFFHDHARLVAHHPPAISKRPRVSLLLRHFHLKLPICRSSRYELVKCMTSHIMQLNFIPFLILASQGHLVSPVRYYSLPLCWALCHHQTSLVQSNFLSQSH